MIHRRGNPTITVRMPRHIIQGLQLMARDELTTCSDIVRQLVEDELTRKGYPTTEQPLEGQVKLE